jgi:hypothetical protein
MAGAVVDASTMWATTNQWKRQRPGSNAGPLMVG